MKKYYGIIAHILHWTVIVLCFYAIGCCGFHWFPYWGYSANYESINTTLLSLALSYFAGYIIYLFTSRLPQKQRENSIFVIWRPNLSVLYNEMSCRIEELREFLSIPQTRMNNLSETDCQSLKNYTVLPSTIVILKEIDKGTGEPEKYQDQFNIKECLNKHYDAVMQCIGELLNDPRAIGANQEIVDILSRIKASDFLNKCNSIIKGPIVVNEVLIDVEAPSMPKAFADYVKLRDELGILPISKYIFKVKKLSEEEVEVSERAQKDYLLKTGITMQMLSEIQKKIVEASK